MRVAKECRERGTDGAASLLPRRCDRRRRRVEEIEQLGMAALRSLQRRTRAVGDLAPTRPAPVHVVELTLRKRSLPRGARARRGARSPIARPPYVATRACSSSIAGPRDRDCIRSSWHVEGHHPSRCIMGCASGSPVDSHTRGRLPHADPNSGRAVASDPAVQTGRTIFEREITGGPPRSAGDRCAADHAPAARRSDGAPRPPSCTSWLRRRSANSRIASAAARCPS